ncbi:hypothetical protein PMAYCL1PPCAC_22856, partial [Pristionchus mayeri]
NLSRNERASQKSFQFMVYVATVKDELYLRGGDENSNYDLELSSNCGECEHWSISKWRQRNEVGVLLKANCSGLFLVARDDHFELFEMLVGQPEQEWLPVKEENGWSFLSRFHKSWFEIYKDDNVSLVGMPTFFELEPWKEGGNAPHKNSSESPPIVVIAVVCIFVGACIAIGISYIIYKSICIRSLFINIC